MSRTYDTVAIVGVGLIGGSIGLAALSRKMAGQVIGIGRNQATLDIALERATITRATTDLADGVREADLVIICTPAATVVDLIRQAAKSCGRATLFTDAASTKTKIVAALAADVQRGLPYVGSHPLAGNHRAGPASAKANLFEGRQVILTPTDDSPSQLVEAIAEFWQALGADICRMTADDHDKTLAVTSHLPHLLAASLAAATDEQLMSLVGSGWRDTTRVAAGNVEMWRDIVSENRENILQALLSFGAVLDEFQVALETSDFPTIIRLLESGKQRRDSVGN